VITISAFKWVPDFARGQVRDLRVRWALEEAGLSYRTRLLEQGDQDKPALTAVCADGHAPTPYLRGRGVGGSSAVNAQVAIRGLPQRLVVVTGTE
jgi:choline dehydrogenase-like flavoprotein